MIMEFLKNRWSPNYFLDQSIDQETLRMLFEAARWAPSSYNEQPWFFIVARKDEPEEFEKLLSLLAPGNAKWAKTAGALVLSVAKLTFDHNGKPNRHAYHDVGMAVENLILQALGANIYAHQMGGFSISRAREIFHLPDSVDPVAVIALGYIKDQETPVNRSRKPLEGFVFKGKWGIPNFELKVPE
ncbi:MAG: nitroreductase [Calditrichaeota bacterium]|nr:nitroreductase [Calditrichota bacterium]